MDWKIFGTTFVTIFLAELGDKTQLAALVLASQSKSIWPVLLGVVMALSIAGLLGVLAGSVLSHWVSPEKLRYVAGPLFIVMGIWIMVKGA